MKRRAGLAALVTAAVAPAAAQQATPEARTVALSLARIMGQGTMVEPIIARMRTQMIELLGEHSGLSPEELGALVDDLLVPEFRAGAGEMLAAYADVWAANFSAEELAEMLRFYESPLGRKALAALPVVEQQSWDAIEAWSGQAMRSALRKHEQTLRARGIH